MDDVQSLISISSQKPKDLGYPWETGQTGEYVKIDDGLEKPFYLPFDLCSTPKDFIGILTHKYKSKQLPGLPQVQRGHFGALNWSESTYITLDNWESMVREGGGVKIAFIMSTWHGFPLGKCMRCYKPRGKNTAGPRQTKCFSCGLEVRRVEPDAIPFEATDVSVGFGPDQYRKYQITSRKKTSPGTTPPATSAPETAKHNTFSDNPPIDFVCKRLIVKWEPIFNFVHRYLHCRCVIRLSTPSHIEKEQTLLTFAQCPRHNETGATHLDYGDLDYHSDKYFDRFGGYRSFQAMIYAFAPNIYEILGREKFLAGEQIDAAFDALNAFRRGDEMRLRKAFLEYVYEVNDELERNGFPLPESAVHGVKDERRRREEAHAVGNKELGFPEFSKDLRKEFQRDIREVPMMKEVDEILDGKWSGKPHWMIED
ncbi:uncharacterized protein LY89DRAFT_328516 [Mollisia scopiformis]|uniref:Ubiquitin-like domain-containing protein n=1 Tax=Mollisia scopiformis TaxID=149040 RepID=A0A132B8Z5_MOLSC|nr:uncharacterized protein LY89DRAFT_328516 [Mollisia scopiformis]KUJ08875.1 hypothetical protein LY89DRAFT_328516 [Mollisia scopiformis]